MRLVRGEEAGEQEQRALAKGLTFIGWPKQTLQHVTASPGKLGQIARAALVLVLFEHKMLT